jgi:drug/metabolite transporter (DMT)-like permease
MVNDTELFSFAVALLVTGILLYGSYWAFAIRRVRTSNLYKRQALSVGAVGVYYGILWIASPFTDQLAPRNVTSFAISAIAFFVGGILIFYWIDQSIRVARRSDPLRRDTFHWTKMRTAIWGLIVLDVVVLATLYGRMESGAQNLTIVENIPFLALFLVTFLIASPALFVAARRSRDPTLHQNLRWFALFVLLVLAYTESGYLSYVLGVPNSASGTYFLISSAIGLIITILPIIGAFALYRSAKSLAPLQPVTETHAEDQRL